MATWQNRITRQGDAEVKDILDNPKNWRMHDDYQGAILADVIDQVGLISHVIINERNGQLVDGHLRVQLARERKEATLPAVYVDLDEAEEAKVLLTHDTIGDLAFRDQESYQALIDQIDAGSKSLDTFLARHGEDSPNGLFTAEGESEAAAGDEEIEDLTDSFDPVVDYPLRFGDEWVFSIPRAAFEKYRDGLYEEVGLAPDDVNTELIRRLGLTPFLSPEYESEDITDEGAVDG